MHELRTLGEVCRAAGVPADRWHRCDAIARYVEMLAHGRMSTRLQDVGMAPTTADSLAAVRLGLEIETLRSRRRRWSDGCA